MCVRVPWHRFVVQHFKYLTISVSIVCRENVIFTCRCECSVFYSFHPFQYVWCIKFHKYFVWFERSVVNVDLYTHSYSVRFYFHSLNLRMTLLLLILILLLRSARFLTNSLISFVIHAFVTDLVSYVFVLLPLRSVFPFKLCCHYTLCVCYQGSCCQRNSIDINVYIYFYIFLYI